MALKEYCLYPPTSYGPFGYRDDWNLVSFGILYAWETPSNFVEVNSSSSAFARIHFGDPDSLRTQGPYGETRALPIIEDVKISIAVTVGGTNIFAETIAKAGSTFVDVHFGNLSNIEPTFIGEINGTTLTVSSILGGGKIVVGTELVSLSLLAAGTKIISNGTGNGGVGTYTINISQTRGSATYQGINIPIQQITLSANSANSLSIRGGVVPFSKSLIGKIIPIPDPIVLRCSNTANVEVFGNIRLSVPVVVATNILCSAYVSARISATSEYLLYAKLAGSVTATGQIKGGVEIAAQSEATAIASPRLSQSCSISATGTFSSSSRGTMSVGSPVGLQAASTAMATVIAKDLIVEQRVSGLPIYVNLETREIVKSDIFLKPREEIELYRNDVSAIDVKFIKAGVPISLSYGSSGRIGVKKEFSEDYLAIDDSWDIVENIGVKIYGFSLNLNTPEINAIFGDDSLDFVLAKFEIEWVESGTINTTIPIVAKIYNDVLR